MIPKSATLVFLGRSGSGKDTQVDFLLEQKEFSGAIKVETGDLFREFAQKDSLLAKKAKEILDNGWLQPYWFAFSMWLFYIREKVKNGEILLASGSPRTLKETQIEDEVLEFMGRPSSVAVFLNISGEEAKRRLLLRARHDDTENGIANRMDYFGRDVVPIVEHYRTEGRLIEINGEQNPEEVFREFGKKLEAYFAK